MSYYGLGLDDRWCAEEVGHAIRDWKAGKHKPYGSIEAYLREHYLLVEGRALRTIKRLEKEQSK